MRVLTNFQTTLSASITSTQDTIPLSSLTTVDGHVLTASDLNNDFYLVVEPGSVKMEIIRCSGITGLNCTGATRGLAFYGNSKTAVPANQKAHDSGSIVIISNVHYYYDDLIDNSSDETIAGNKTFSSSPIVPTPTQDYHASTKKFVSDTITGFTGTATSTTAGTTKLSLDPAIAGTPIAVGDNDTRMPNQSENDALVGTSGTPSSANKYVTNDDTSATSSASKIVRANGSGKIVEGFLQTTDANITDLTDGGETTLHKHSSELEGLMGIKSTTNANINFSLPFTSNSNWTASNYTPSYDLSSVELSPAAATNTLISSKRISPVSTWNTTKTHSLEVNLNLSASSASSQQSSFGIVTTTTGIAIGDTTQSAIRMGIIQSVAGAWTFYCETCDSATNLNSTTVSLVGITLTNYNTFKMVFIPSVSVTFYINGVQVAQHTTNLPNNAADMFFGVRSSGSANGQIANVFNPYFSITK